MRCFPQNRTALERALLGLEGSARHLRSLLPAERFGVRRSLGLTQLTPGSYDLAVTITADGREVRREQRIVVR